MSAPAAGTDLRSSGGEPRVPTGSDTVTGRHRWWSLAPWLVLAAVVVVALAVGSGLGSSGTPSTPAARISHLDSEIRCPSCVDLSVAQSQASTAVAIRNYITQQVGAGASDQAIISYLESRYGTGILMMPQGGVGTAAWGTPVVVVAVILGVVVTLFARRARRRLREEPAPLSDSDEELVAEAMRTLAEETDP